MEVTPLFIDENGNEDPTGLARLAGRDRIPLPHELKVEIEAAIHRELEDLPAAPGVGDTFVLSRPIEASPGESYYDIATRVARAIREEVLDRRRGGAPRRPELPRPPVQEPRGPRLVPRPAAQRAFLGMTVTYHVGDPDIARDVRRPDQFPQALEWRVTRPGGRAQRASGGPFSLEVEFDAAGTWTIEASTFGIDHTRRRNEAVHSQRQVVVDATTAELRRERAIALRSHEAIQALPWSEIEAAPAAEKAAFINILMEGHTDWTDEQNIAGTLRRVRNVDELAEICRLVDMQEVYSEIGYERAKGVFDGTQAISGPARDLVHLMRGDPVLVQRAGEAQLEEIRRRDPDDYADVLQKIGTLHAMRQIPAVFVPFGAMVGFPIVLVGGPALNIPESETLMGDGYKIVDPVFERRTYTGATREAAWDNYLANARFPPGCLVWVDPAEPSATQYRYYGESGWQVADWIMTGAAALGIGLAVVAALAPEPVVTKAAAAWLGGASAAYFGARGVAEIHDALTHGQHVTDRAVVMNAIDVVASACALGALARQGTRVAAICNLLGAGADVVQLGLGVAELQRIANEGGRTEEERKAAVRRHIGSLLASGAIILVSNATIAEDLRRTFRSGPQHGPRVVHIDEAALRRESAALRAELEAQTRAGAGRPRELAGDEELGHTIGDARRLGRAGFADDIRSLDTRDDDAVIRYIQANVGNDHAMLALYQRMGRWDEMRRLARYRGNRIPEDLWTRVDGARTRLVLREYGEVYALMASRHPDLRFTDAQGRSVFPLEDPAGTDFLVGTPPTSNNWGGVRSDVDVNMRFRRDALAALRLNPAQQDEILVEAKRLLDERLRRFFPDSGANLDTNVYISPSRFRGLTGEALERSQQAETVMGYMAIREGCGRGSSGELMWRRIRDRALEISGRVSAAEQQRVRGLLEAGEARWREYVRLEADLGEVGRARHFEERLQAFIQQHGDRIVTDPMLQADFNRLKADYIASLRETYWTEGGTRSIVEQARDLTPIEAHQARCDQARYLLHYLDGALVDEQKMRRALQKIAKYEQRELEALGLTAEIQHWRDAGLLQLFADMKARPTVDDAWRVWCHWHVANVPPAERAALAREIGLAETATDAELMNACGVRAARVHIQRLEEKLVDIAAELPPRAGNR